MRVGVISDVHADLEALERALSLLVAHGADKIVCLGDVVEKGPDGDAVVACLDDWAIPVVNGNHEDNAAKHAALAPGEAPLRPETLARIAAYPTARLYCWERLMVLAAHGTPRDNRVYVFPGEAVPRALKKQMRTPVADVVLLGHTHQPMAGWYRNTLFLNPGSVYGRKPRDSHSCGLLSLPDLGWRVFDLETGAERAVSVPVWSRRV